MLADLHRDGTANRLNLGGLDEDDVTTYVAEAGYDDEELAHALASVTGGNPSSSSRPCATSMRAAACGIRAPCRRVYEKR